MSQLKKGALLSYTNIFLKNITGIFLTPIIITLLGDSEYGLYTLVGSFVSYFILMDFGLNNTVTRFVAKYKAENNKIGEENFLAIVTIIYCTISLVVIFLGTIFYFNLESIFDNSLTPEELRKAKIMFIILIFDIAVFLPTGSFGAILDGYENFVINNTLNIIRQIFRPLLIILLLYLGGRAVEMVILDTVIGLIATSIMIYVIFKKLKVKFKLHFFSKPLIKEVFGYSIWIFIVAITQSFQWQSGQVILGITTNTTAVAVYGIGIMLGTFYGGFAVGINSVLLPRATQMIVRKESGIALTEMTIRAGRLVLTILCLVLGGFIAFGQEFIFLWVGEVYKDSWIIALLCMLATTVPLTQSFGISILQANNKIKSKAILNFITIALGVIFGYFVTKWYDGVGMIFCIATAMTINTIITNIYFIKYFDFQALLFLKSTFVKPMLVLITMLIIGLIINYFVANYNWITLIIKIVIFTILYSFLAVKFVLNEEEKITIFKFLRVEKILNY